MSLEDHITTLAIISGVIIVLLVVALIGVVALQPALTPDVTVTPGPTVIVNASTPTPSPTWIIDVNNGSTPTPGPKPNVTTTPEWNIPPSPTPATPTPNPFAGERLSPKKDSDVLPSPDHTSTDNGIIAWDPSNCHGVSPYYYVGDHAMIRASFISTANVTNPEITITIKKEMNFGVYMTIPVGKTWVEPISIQPQQKFNTQIFEFDVPDYTGNYILEIEVKVNGKRECWISQDFSIFRN
jgi:hypothetical protein